MSRGKSQQILMIFNNEDECISQCIITNVPENKIRKIEELVKKNRFYLRIVPSHTPEYIIRKLKEDYRIYTLFYGEEENDE